jgi:acyl-CoA thioesterase II
MNVREFLGLRATHNPHRWYLPVEEGILTRGGFLFGGCGLAAAVAALEATSGRALIWATAQYLDYARPPSFLDIDVIIPVAGRQTTQARALGHVGDREILTVNAALGDREFDVVAQWEVPPDVPPPADCPEAPSFQSDVAGTINSRFEIRVARGRYGAERDGTPSHDGRSALWIRVPAGIEMSAGLLAITRSSRPSGCSATPASTASAAATPRGSSTSGRRTGRSSRPGASRRSSASTSEAGLRSGAHFASGTQPPEATLTPAAAAAQVSG